MSPPIAIETNGYGNVYNDVKLKAHNSSAIAYAEDYTGNYKFAPIRESDVSRAMIKRYFQTMYDRCISDVVIVGAGSAGLSCAHHLAKNNPEMKITIIEANVAPGGGAWLGGQLMTPMVRVLFFLLLGPYAEWF